ncbi:MAG: NUDIX hydrolase [Paracoccaceae bacterium]|nr:NUDIX hydrolase [Paracoccaceae bacterium]
MGSVAVIEAAQLAIRPAATIILSRQGSNGPEVLMGQRGHAAAFMPSKYVFPGGAVDAGDAEIRLFAPPPDACVARLASDGPPPEALAAAAIRELWEETGLALGRTGVPAIPAPAGWGDFAARRLVPDASGLRFIFRAITPPGRTRRFDARFFLADAAGISGDINDFSAASDELSHLHWIALSEVRHLDLPFITEVVLAEAGALLRGVADEGVPFFDNSGATPTFRRLR